MEIFENIIDSYANESITTSTILDVLLMVAILAIYEFFGVRIDIWTHFMRGCIIELCTLI